MDVRQFLALGENGNLLDELVDIQEVEDEQDEEPGPSSSKPIVFDENLFNEDIPDEDVDESAEDEDDQDETDQEDIPENIGKLKI